MIERSDMLRCLAALFATLAAGSLAMSAAVSSPRPVTAGAAIGPLLLNIAAPVA